MRLPKQAALAGAIFAVVGVFWTGAAAVHAAEPEQLGNGIEVGTSYQNDVSLPLYYLPEWRVDEGNDREEREAAENPRIPSQHVDSADPVIQNLSQHAPGGYMPAPILSFDGMANGCGCSPPDTNGEVGETQYVQMTNSGYQVFDKSTGASVLGPVATSSIWAGFGGFCETNGRGDPVVLYDQLAKRWVITQFAGSGSVITDECIAVSTTSDATASYYRYGFHLGSNFYDYPHLGMWPDGYYMSMNVFNAAGTSYLGPQAFAFNRTAMLAGTPGATFLTTSAPLGSTFAPLLPSDLDGSSPPPLGAPNPFVMFPANGKYDVYRFHADFATPANTTFTLASSPAAAGFSTLCGSSRSCVPQKGTTVGLDGIGDRLMFRLAYRNFGDHEALVGNYTVLAGGVAAPRWFELRGVTSGNASVYQEGTYQPDTDWRWIGSAAMDIQGNLAIAYSASSSTIYPQLRYAGRLVGDPLNTLGQAETHLFDGPSNQTLTGNRWGDYSDLTVDPVDDCTFWFTSEYGIGGNYKTRIGNFKFPGCSIFPGFSLNATPASTAVCAGSPATFTVNVGATAGFTGAVSLAGSGNPAPSSLAFNPATVSSLPGTSVLTVANTASVANGLYPIAINGTATGASAQSTTVNLSVFAGVPAAPTLVAPADASVNQPPTLAFSWSGSNAQDYTIDIATDAAFTSIIATATVSGTSFTPAAPLQRLTTYYWRVRSNSPCGNSTESPVRSFTTGVPFPEPYCAAAFSNAVEPITRVVIGGINNTSSATVNGSPALEDFTAVLGTVTAGANASIAVEGNTDGSFTTYISAYIDWNHNGTFDTGEGYNIGSINSSTGTDGKQATGTIAVPAGALAGTTRMRVIKKYATSVSYPAACNTAGYGQAEDYTITVGAGGLTYTVAGTVSGLAGSGLVLQLNGGNNLPVITNGNFTFAGGLASGANYAVTVSTQPSSPPQTCTVTNGSGTIGSANVTNVVVTCTTVPTYTVGGAVSGLAGSGLSLKLNGGTSLPISASGAFMFPDNLTSGTAYGVTVGTQPSGQTCSIANGSGTMGTANVTNVAVTCVTVATYTVGGTVSGLVGSGLTLKLNGGTGLPISASGAFTFPDNLTSGTAYGVTIGTQPSGQTCSVANGSGTMGSGNVTNVAVTCVTAMTYTVGGTVSGLTGSGLALRLNGGTDLPISADGVFTFPGGLTGGTAYAVTVGTQASGQTCSVANGAGQIGSANVTNVLITCATIPPQMYTVGGHVSGVVGSGLVLQINGGATVSMGANGLFVFTGGLPTGATYAVTVATSPSNPAQTCTIANGSGTIASANVTNVMVACAAPITDRIFIDGFDGTP